jgi:hypothetical protein
MMAARRDIDIYQGDTYGHVLTVADDATPPNPTDVSARTFAAQLRRYPLDSTVAAQFAVDMTGASSGVVEFSLPAVTTAALVPGKYSWDVHMVTGSSVLTLVAGECVVTAEVTR